MPCVSKFSELNVRSFGSKRDIPNFRTQDEVGQQRVRKSEWKVNGKKISKIPWDETEKCFAKLHHATHSTCTIRIVSRHVRTTALRTLDRLVN